jgi:hypothetical protein
MAINSSDLVVQELPTQSAAGTGLTDTVGAAAEALYNYEQDTNRLARGNPTGTVVDMKDSTRRRNIPVASSIDTWDEPLSPYAASYPHNNVYQTPNGLIQEFDDTPNNIRYHRYHPSGTYTEVDANGTEVRKIVGDNFYIIENNGYIFIGGEANITVSGKCNIIVMNDCNLQIDGKLDAVVKNDINLTSSGNFNLNVKETFKIKADNMVVETNKHSHKNVGPSVIETDTLDTKVIGAHTAKADTFGLKTDGTTTFNAAGEFQVSASKLSVETDLHVKNSVFVETEVNSPLFKGVARYAQYAVTAGGAPTGTASPTSSDRTAPTVNNVVVGAPAAAATTGFLPPANRSNPDRSARPPLSQVANRVIRAGIENDDGARPSVPLYPGYNTAPPYVPSDQPAPGNIDRVETIPVDDSAIIDRVGFTGEEQLSSYVKLKDVSTNAIFGHRVRAQAGLTEGQIVSNLQALSINVLDKLVEKYGKGSFVITSAFRPATQARGGQGISQHGFGQAVDIQFPTLPNSEYAARAQELLSVIPFDQLLLEYQSTGSGRPWIHISFNKQGNRRQYFTMFNHQRSTPIMIA